MSNIIHILPFLRPKLPHRDIIIKKIRSFLFCNSDVLGYAEVAAIIHQIHNDELNCYDLQNFLDLLEQSSVGKRYDVR